MACCEERDKILFSACQNGAVYKQAKICFKYCVLDH